MNSKPLRIENVPETVEKKIKKKVTWGEKPTVMQKAPGQKTMTNFK